MTAHVVKLACEMPHEAGCPISLWDCQEIAWNLVTSGLVPSISPQTVQRMLDSHRLKPWRVRMWQSEKAPRDEEFYGRVEEIIDLYTRSLADNEMVLCVDEKTNLQPRPRPAATKGAGPGGKTVLVEPEYKRAGALNLIAGFDTRTGRVYAVAAERKRQAEFIEFLEHLDRQLPPEKTVVRMVLDNLRMHKGKEVAKWLAGHPRFTLHFTPVHCSWMNQVEQWFSILQRKRLRISDFESKAHLQEALLAFVAHWNERAHPFAWSPRSVEKVMAKRQAPAAASQKALNEAA